MKEYEVLFKLGAALGSNFNGTFTSARKVIQAAEKEIQALNKQQADITAYQRQQTTIDRTNAKLDTYRKQLENVRAEIAQSDSANSELANRELELRQRIQNTEQAIADKNQRLQQMGEALAEAGVNVNALGEEQQRLQQRTQELSDQQQRAAEEAEQFGEKSASAFELAGNALVTAGIAKGLNAIYDAYKDCVNISMDFGGTMSTVEALSGASSAEMEELSAEARNLGATTKFTANESAQAMTYMGMAGWDAQEMLDGMNGVLNLAAASNEDLALTSDIVTDNLTAFGLTASDTAHFADVLAQTASKSNTSVAIMGETFAGSASIAGALGYSIEDVATAIGLMANSGVKGSVASTALKNTFNGILEGATLSAAAIGEVEFSALNSDGTLKSFGQTLDELRGYFEQMTEAERVSNAMAIAGQRGYNGLLAILNSTSEDYESLRDNINNCTGAAERMSKIQLDNLKGDVTLLDSAADGLKETIGGLYNDELRNLAQAGANILTSVNEFTQNNPVLVKSIMAIGAEIGVVVLAYNAWNVAKKAKNALDEFGIALKARKAAASAAAAAAETGDAAATTGATAAQTGWNMAMLASPIFIFTAAIAAVTAGVIALNEVCKVADFETNTLTESSQRQKNELDELNAKYQEACETYGENSQQAQALKYDVDQATESFEANKRTVEDLYNELDSLHNSYGEILGTYSETNSEIYQQSQTTTELTAKMRSLNDAAKDGQDIDSELSNIIAKLNEQYPELGLNIKDVNGHIDETIAKVNGVSEAEKKKAQYENALKTRDDLAEQQAQLEQLRDEAEQAMLDAGKVFTDNGAKVVWQNFVGAFTNTDGQIQKAYNEAQDKYWQAAADAREGNAALEECNAIIAEYEGMVEGAADSTATSYDAILLATNEVQQASEDLLESYKKAYDEAYDSITGQYKIWDTAATVIPTSIQTINDAMETQINYWSNYNTDLDNLSKRADDIEGLQEMLAAFSDGSEESVNAVAGFAKATDEQLKTAVENWKTLKEQQGDTAEGLAGLKVDMENGLQDIADTMEEKIEAMNLSDQAKEAAEATLQAYVDALNSGKTTAADAAAAVSAAVTAAFATGSTNTTTNVPSEKVYDGSVRGFRELEDMSKYASGTLSADSGYALVGEEGPEIVRMAGGERVFNANDTAAIARDMSSSGGGQTTITISPVFNVSGSADQSSLAEYADTLVEMVMDALEMAGVDSRRLAYT